MLCCEIKHFTGSKDGHGLIEGVRHVRGGFNLLHGIPQVFSWRQPPVGLVGNQRLNRRTENRVFGVYLPNFILKGLVPHHTSLLGHPAIDTFDRRIHGASGGTFTVMHLGCQGFSLLPQTTVGQTEDLLELIVILQVVVCFGTFAVLVFDQKIIRLLLRSSGHQLR